MARTPQQRALFDEAYELYADALYRLCLYKTTRKEIAEDLVQDIFMRFLSVVDKGTPIDNVRAYLYRIAGNLIIDHYRKKKTSSLDALGESGYDPVGDGKDSIENASEIHHALNILKTLPEKYRDVVYLRLVEDMTMDEIADALSITRTNATVRFHRGIKKLQETLGFDISYHTHDES